MARVRDVEIDEVPEDVRPIFRRFAEHGPFANQVKVFAHRPVAVRHIHGLLLALADEAVLAQRYLEIAVVTVSKLNECRYCVAHHTPRLTDTGVAAAAVARILEPDCPGLDRVDRLVRDYAVAVTERPQAVPDAMFAALKQHFSEAQIVELTLRTALCGFFNRFNDALQIDMEDRAIAELLATGAKLADLPAGGRPGQIEAS